MRIGLQLVAAARHRTETEELVWPKSPAPDEPKLPNYMFYTNRLKSEPHGRQSKLAVIFAWAYSRFTMVIFLVQASHCMLSSISSLMKWFFSFFN